ncbi:MAG: DNA-binding protein WhiA [Caldisericia bacterium]|jgi:DNA-binding protein WhiA|nr:DNA-binding protein WhiA [Caldisericia bacterium]
MENLDLYSITVKRDLLRTKINDYNEVIAEIQGFLITCGKVILSKDYTKIVFLLSSPEISRRVITDSNKIFKTKKDIKLVKKRGKNFIEISYEIKLDDLIKSEIIDENDLKVHFKPKGENAVKSFLRGAFLGSGVIRNPKKGYYLEIRFNKESSYYEFYEITKIFHFNFKEREKDGYNILYLQNKDDIKEFLLFIGASYSYFSLFENLIMKDMKNELTKNLNFELKNLKKTVDAYVKARDAIIYIKEKGYYKKLTPALKEIVDLRLKYPELSLRELALKLGVSKSCVNHRLRRIIEIAGKLKNEK